MEFDAHLVWTVLIWIGWVGVAVVATVMTVLFLAFADSPDANRAAQRAVSPGFTWLACAFGGGFTLMLFGTWWAYILAYLAAITPPVAMFMIVSYFMNREKAGR